MSILLFKVLRLHLKDNIYALCIANLKLHISNMKSLYNYTKVSTISSF